MNTNVIESVDSHILVQKQLANNPRGKEAIGLIDPSPQLNDGIFDCRLIKPLLTILRD